MTTPLPNVNYKLTNKLTNELTNETNEIKANEINTNEINTPNTQLRDFANQLFFPLFDHFCSPFIERINSG